MEKECPYRFGLPKKDRGCIEHRCQFFTNLVGTHPNTGEQVNEWGCAIAWLPVLLVENASKIRQATASIDKTATEVSKQHASLLGMASDEARARLLKADPQLRLANGSHKENGL